MTIIVTFTNPMDYPEPFCSEFFDVVNCPECGAEQTVYIRNIFDGVVYRQCGRCRAVYTEYESDG